MAVPAFLAALGSIVSALGSIIGFTTATNLVETVTGSSNPAEIERILTEGYSIASSKGEDRLIKFDSLINQLRSQSQYVSPLARDKIDSIIKKMEKKETGLRDELSKSSAYAQRSRAEAELSARQGLISPDKKDKYFNQAKESAKKATELADKVSSEVEKLL